MGKVGFCPLGYKVKEDGLCGVCPMMWDLLNLLPGEVYKLC